jgi:hypothetical protein
LKAGPTSFFSTAWHDMQFLAVARAWLAWAWGVPRVMTVHNATGRLNCFMRIFDAFFITLTASVAVVFASSAD